MALSKEQNLLNKLRSEFVGSMSQHEMECVANKYVAAIRKNPNWNQLRDDYETVVKPIIFSPSSIHSR